MGLAWKLLSEKSDDPKRIVWAFENIMKGDQLLTFPSVIAILITSFLIQDSFHFPVYFISFPFLISLTFIYSSTIFFTVVSPLRRKIYGIVVLAGTMENLAKTDYKKLSLRWMIIGLAELAPPVTLLILSLSQLKIADSSVIPA